jgi:signal transduction histidine kinase
MLAISIVGAGVATVIKLPRVAATTAVAGIVVLGLGGAWEGVRWLTAQYPTFILFYGAVPLHDSLTQLVAAAQGIVLLVAGGLLAPRLLTWAGDATLAKRAQALTQRVDRLTQTRTDATDTAVAELRRIERDLHDGAQQRLVALALELRTAQQQLGRGGGPAVQQVLAEAVGELQAALTDLRELGRGLHPAILTEEGLAAALESLADRSPLPVSLVACEERLSDRVEATAYFVVCEALANALKHSRASSLAVATRRTEESFVVEVADDGVGGAHLDDRGGLRGLADRVEALGGSLSVDSAPLHGTRVIAEIPCAR